MSTRLLMGLAAAVALFALTGLDEVTCIPTKPGDVVCTLATDCIGMAHLSCPGDWTCFYGTCVWECAPLSPEVCDGWDNDGDGLVDEDVVWENGNACIDQGVCVGLQPVCAGALGWQCVYDGVDEYEAVEISCDGLDNDCDGLVDEELDWKEMGACKSLGVCDSPLLEVECKGESGWECHYDSVGEDYQAVEFSCDGLDNDCDGNVDMGACSPCEPCTTDWQCATVACKKTMFGEQYCSVGNDKCVLSYPEVPQCWVLQSGEKACKSSTQPALCTQDGVWFDNLQPCEDPTPACFDGECMTCLPGAKRCQGNIIQFCTDGIQWTDQFICAPGYVCIGDGKCVGNDEFLVAGDVLVSGAQSSPTVAVTEDGRVAIAWTDDSVGGGAMTDIVARFHSDDLSPAGPTVVVNTVLDSAQTEPAMAGMPFEDGGFVAAWTSEVQDGSGKGVFGALFSNTGERLVADDIQFNTFTEGDQEHPSVAAFYNGDFLVVWESVALPDPGLDNDGRGIYMRLYKADGTSYWDTEKLVNSFTSNDQRWPDVAARDDEGYVITWTSTSQDGANQAVVFVPLDQGGNKVDQEFFTPSSQKRSTVAGFGGVRAGWHVIAWESFGQDGSSNGVFMNIFNSESEPQWGMDIPVNEGVLTGSQKDPDIAVLDDNSVVVVWETPNLDGDGYAVAARVFDQWGNPVDGAEEFQVNFTEAGDQENPMVAAIDSCHYVVVWDSVTNVPFNVDIFARVPGVP